MLEPFITPELYMPYVDSHNLTGDEWTLSAALGNDLEPVLTRHYDTFITERDFAAIARAGLNWIRLPVAYWAIETWPGEPFLARVSWSYLVKAVRWARKYGLRVNLDLHAVPGSQNGWNHSGRLGDVNFLHGPMGLANAQRALDYIRIFAGFVDEHSTVIQMFSVLNEPLPDMIGLHELQSFYFRVYEQVRSSQVNVIMAIHDGFQRLSDWKMFLPGADRLALDMHPYLAFRAPNVDSFDLQALKVSVLLLSHAVLSGRVTVSHASSGRAG